MDKESRVAALQALIRSSGSLAREPQAKAPLGIETLDHVLGGGLATGLLHEIYGAAGRDAGAATGFALGLARRLTGNMAPIVWLVQSPAAGEYGHPYAPGLAEMGIDPNRLLLVQVRREEELLEAALQTARTLAGGVAVLEPHGEARQLDLTAGRKLALAAEASGVSLLLLKIAAVPVASTAATRWRVSAAPSHGMPRHLMGPPRLQVELMRNRNGRTGTWIVEWNSDESVFASAPALQPQTVPLSGVVAALPRNGSDGEAMAGARQQEGLRQTGWRQAS
jgi:protein ImuA